MFLAMVLAAPAAPWKKGDKLEIRWGGQWYKGEVLEVNGESYKVRYDGYSAAWDEWATAEKLRDIGSAPPEPAPVVGPWKQGDRVEAQSYGSWYPATVLLVEPGRVRVTYDGFSSSSDEWVTHDKVRALRLSSWKVGDRVEALSYGTWYPAKIVEAEQARWKVNYDQFPSSDEWVNTDRLRLPGAGAAAAGGLAFAARPAGKTAGLEGVWLRVESFYFGGSLSLNNQGWFFTKDGRVSRSPSGGFDFQALAAAEEARTSDGVYWIEDDKLFVTWAGESEPTEYSFARKPGELVIGGIGSTPVEGFKRGWRADAAYEGGASVGGGAVASSTTIILRRDGTFSRDSIGSISATAARTEVSAYAQTNAAGTYEFDGYTLTLTERDGTVTKHTVFAFSDRDAQGAPEYMWRDGGMMRRQ